MADHSVIIIVEGGELFSPARDLGTGRCLSPMRYLVASIKPRTLMRILLAFFIVSCSMVRPLSYYHGSYRGILKTSCYPLSCIEAIVSDTQFLLSLDVNAHTITGTLHPDGSLDGDAICPDQEKPVRFEGSISGPMFGRTFSGTVFDGRCDPHVSLYPPRQGHT
jgi:hypothetical protein